MQTKEYFFDHLTLAIYNTFRIVLLVILSILYLVKHSLSASLWLPETLIIASALMLFFTIYLQYWAWQKTLFLASIFFALLIDIAIIHTFSYLNGGFQSAVLILLTAPIAMAQFFFKGKTAFFFPSLAAITVLGEVFFFALLQTPLYEKYYSPAAILSITFFIEAGVLRFLISKTNKAEKQAKIESTRSKQLETINGLIVEKMQTGVIIFDQHLNILQVNKSAIELTACLLENKTSLNTTALAKPANNWLNNQQTAPKTLEIQGLQHELSISFSAIDNCDDNPQFIAFLTNQSEIKRQAQLYKLSSLGRLSASIAHEIRNPLTAIQQASQLLEQNDTPAATEDQKLLSMIIKHCKRIDGIISNVSQIAKRDSGTPEQLDLNMVISDVLTDLTVQFPKLSIHQELPTPCLIQFDKGHLYQVLHNLLQNALTYSLQYQHKATADITVHVQDNGLCQLYIQDDGPGVHKDFQHEIFEPFFSKRKGGSGLGLYLAREFCELNMANLEYTTLNNRHAFKISFSHPNKKMH